MTNEELQSMIYNLKLHEKYLTTGFEVLRVPGGWIYRFWDFKKDDYVDHSIFIPLNDEFRTVKGDAW